MSDRLSRRRFLETAVAAGAGAAAAVRAARGADAEPSGGEKRVAFRSNLVVNDDGHVFLGLNDDLRKEDLRRYLQSYCRDGVGAVAYCVGDMTWPTLYPTQVGVHYSAMRRGADVKPSRGYRNVDNFASEPGGYFGTAFRILRELGKTALASFRMNDAHFTSPENPRVSEFWKQHAKLSLGTVYGYYGGSLNYAFEVVRSHFRARVEEFVGLYPEIDGIELDAMRSPFFFAPDKGKEQAPLFTEMVRDVKTALRDQARRLKRPDYLLTANVPFTPELALECGLDVVAWDAEGLFDCISVGPYQAYMNHPMEEWKRALKQGTPVYAYIGCSQQTGQYLGLEEYRAAAANAHACGADGVYLFNYPCLFELSSQMPCPPEDAGIALPDLRGFGHPDLTRVGQSLDEMARPDLLRHQDKRFLFYWCKDTHYRHYAPDVESFDRGEEEKRLEAVFRCYEDYDRAKVTTLAFKIENVARSERFEITLNGRRIDPGDQRVRYASNGRDTRIHTVKLEPYLRYEVSLKPGQLNAGENTLEIRPTRLVAELVGKIHLVEIELAVRYG
ncbi:MAG TPA: hypothetical protein VMY37_09855 [Thermoguttaceae bacterium]|nr:hypothetical protein [Thermoguttaceae bacterium]